MFSYLQSKFTLPLFLRPESDPDIEEVLNLAVKNKEQIELRCEDLVYMKQLVLAWSMHSNKPVVWMNLDSLDQDPGRFWSVLIYGLRKHYHHFGKPLLAGIMDHHASPNKVVLDQFAESLAGKPFLLVLSGCEHIQKKSVTKQLLLIWPTLQHESTVVYLNEENGDLFEENPTNLRILSIKSKREQADFPAFPPERNLLSLLDSWWLAWMKQEALLPDVSWLTYMESTGDVNFNSNKVVLPSARVRKALRNTVEQINYEKMTETLRSLCDWLLSRGEWLEAYRWMLFIKDFEQAGEVMEKEGFLWLENKGDPLTLLFWLRELPSVLLTAKPMFAYLAARAAFELGLYIQARFYLDHAEQNLAGLSRFSRSQEILNQTPITETGITYQQMNNMLAGLKKKL